MPKVVFTGYRIEEERRDELLAQSIDFRPFVDGLFSAPEEIDPRVWHRMERQSRNDCQGHALSSVGEYCYRVAGGDGAELIQFSPQWCYIKSQMYDGIRTDSGSTLAGGVKTAKQDGFATLEACPYPSSYTRKLPAGAAKDAATRKIRSSSACRSYLDVFQYLSSGIGGVEIGIAWGSGFKWNGKGVIEKWYGGQGGHAVCFLGYSKRKDRSGRKYLWMVNSHGKTWGVNGYAEVAPSAVDAMCAHRYTVMYGLSDMTVPAPRPVDFSKESYYG